MIVHVESCKQEKLWLISTFCNYKTLNKTDFKDHFKKMHNDRCLNIELEKKTFKCDICGYMSKDKIDFYKHSKTKCPLSQS